MDFLVTVLQLDARKLLITFDYISDFQVSAKKIGVDIMIDAVIFGF